MEPWTEFIDDGLFWLVLSFCKNAAIHCRCSGLRLPTVFSRLWHNTHFAGITADRLSGTIGRSGVAGRSRRRCRRRRRRRRRPRRRRGCRCCCCCCCCGSSSSSSVFLGGRCVKKSNPWPRLGEFLGVPRLFTNHR